MVGHRKLFAWAALTGSILTLSGHQTQTSGAARICADVLVMDMHGSSEGAYVISPPGQEFVASLRQLLKPRRVYVTPVPFKAAGGPGTFIGAALKIPAAYFKSAVQMKVWLRGQLQKPDTSCPNTKVILVGYSQGAQAAADVYQERTWPQVAGVVLFGDPYYNHTDSSDRFGLNFPAKRRIAAKLDGALGTRPAFNSRSVLSFCHQEDPVCQAPLGHYEILTYWLREHKNYDKFGEPKQAARYFVSSGLLGNSKTPSAPSKWPTGRHQGTTALFIELGADGISPDWSSCSDNYCIVGSGSTVYVFKLHGLEELGTIPLNVADPHAALANGGIPEADIAKMLGP